MLKKNMAEVWNHYKKSENREKASCKYCSARISCKGSSTSGLIRHLSAIHPENANKRKEIPSPDAGPSAPKISKLQPTTSASTKPKPFTEILAKLCAYDGFIISGVCRSSFIRESLRARGFEMPEKKSQVMELIYDYYEFAKLRVIERIDAHKKEDSWPLLSLTLDEFSTYKNRRYLNINVHYLNGNYDNLGAIRIYKTCSVGALKSTLKQKLAGFHINFKDVLATTTSDPSVMKKFGNVLPFKVHHFCWNRGIHLAVCDFLYKETTRSQSNIELDDDLSHGEDGSTLENGEGTDDEYDHEEEEENEEFFASMAELQDEFKTVLDNVRKIAKLFKTSIVKNSVLQNHVMKEHGKQLHLVLDSPTRWESIPPMLERYLLLKTCIEKALVDLNSPVKLCEDEVAIIEELLHALKPVQLAVEAMGAKDCTLVTSEGIIKFLFNSLRDLAKSSLLALKLLEALIERLRQRRSNDLISLVMYLQNPENLKTTSDFYKNDEVVSGKAVSSITKYAKDLVNEYFLFDIEWASELQYLVKVEDEGLPSTSEFALRISLENAIMASHRSVEEITPDKILTLEKELMLYEATGTKAPNLKRLYNSLMTIKPTSVQAERVFSNWGTSDANKCAPLSDYSVDALCFLKTYFKNKLDMN